MQSKSKQGALSCGLVLMLAATVTAMPKAAIKKLRSLEPSVQQEMNGLPLDEERRAGECTKAAPDNKCPWTLENCNHFYISEVHEGKHEAVMCRNPSGSFWRGKNNGEGRQCTDRSAGKLFGKARKVCPGDKKSLLNPAFTALLMAASRRGQVNVVRALLEVDGIDVNKADSNGETALIAASSEGHVDVVSMLLNVDGIDVNKADRDYGDTALILASLKGHLGVVQALLGVGGIEVNKQNIHGRTALMYASSSGNLEIVRMLLAFDGIEVNHADRYGDTALMMARNNGHTNVENMLRLAVE